MFYLFLSYAVMPTFYCVIQSLISFSIVIEHLDPFSFFFLAEEHLDTLIF